MSRHTIIVALLAAMLQFAACRETAHGYEPTPDDPTAAISERRVKLTDIHEKYAVTAAELKKQAAAAVELADKLNKAPPEYRNLVQQRQVAQANVNSAKARLWEAQDTHRTETDWETKRVTRTDPNTGKRVTENQRVQTTKRVPKDGAEQRREINAANESLANAQLALNRINAQGQELETFMKQGPPQLQQLNKAVAAEKQKVESLADDWLDVIDGGRAWSTPEHQAIVSLCNAWITADPNDAPARLARGVSARWLNDPAARTDLDVMVKEPNPFQERALLTRAVVRANLGDEKEGFVDVGQAMKFKQRDPRVFLSRALIYCRQEKFTAAEADLKTVIRSRKDDPEPLCLLVLVYASAAKNRDATQALAQAQRACDLTESKDWTCLDALAAAQAEAGQFDEAVKTIEQASDLTFADKRQQCLDRKKLYEQRQPLRLDWK